MSIVKSAQGQTGSKFTNKRAHPLQRKKVSPYRKGMTVNQALAEGAKKPNMSRRSPTNVLIAFPTFDKCDSLIYFPSTLARLVNCDDMTAASKLFATHFHKECVIDYIANVNDVTKFTPKSFVSLLQIANILEPDRIMCVHSTRVVENQIRATVYMKLTDTQPLYDYMSKTLSSADASIAGLCQRERAQRLKYYIHDELVPEHVKRDIMTHSESLEDLLLYVQCNLTMTFDDVTKKIVHMHMTYVLTSVQPVASPTAS